LTGLWLPCIHASGVTNVFGTCWEYAEVEIFLLTVPAMNFTMKENSLVKSISPPEGYFHQERADFRQHSGGELWTTQLNL